MVGPEQDVAQEPDGGDRPWERPGAVRRDCAPHRGRLLGVLGGLALVCAALSTALLCLVPPPLGLEGFVPSWLSGVALGGVVFALGRRDLQRMAAGRMDPEGEAATEGARNLAFVALVVGVWTFLPGALFSVLFLVR